MSGGHDAGGGLRWLLTYADMITLLMAFFIMMYSISVISMEKFSKAAASFRAEFGPARGSQGGGGREILPRPGAAGASLPALEEDVQSVKEQLEQYVKANQLEDIIHTSQEARGLVITLVSDNLLFPVGDAQLRAPALTILDKIARLLRDLPNLVVIEGHTCSLPISTPQYPSNWELSAARASAVVRYLVERWRIDPIRLAAAGYADSRPVASNEREQGRALNRRVEIVILASIPDDRAQATPAMAEQTGLLNQPTRVSNGSSR